MDRQIEVTGADTTQPDTVPPAVHGVRWSPLITGLAGLLVGAASMFVVTANEPPLDATAPAQDDLPAPAIVTSQATLPPEPTLRDLVPDLETDLLGFGFTPGGSSIVQRWRADDTEPRSVDVPFGLAIRDLSGRWIAALTAQRYGDSSNLQVGNPEYVEALATGVSSAVWSSDQAGRIAWTERTAAGTTVTRDAAFELVSRRTEFAAEVSGDARAVWFDGDNLVLAVGDGLTGLGPDGLVMSTLDSAHFVTGSDDWAIALIEDELRLIDAGLQVGAALPVEGSCLEARFAPHDAAAPRRLAVLCDHEDGPPTISVIDVDPSTDTFIAGIVVPIDESGPISWIDGDRFLAIPQPDATSRPRTRVVIVDTITAQVIELDWRGAIFQVIGTR